jgi:general secretion pathway protein C
VPKQAVAVSTAAGARGDLDRLLGQNVPAAAEAAPVSADAGRFQLVGVVAPRGDAGDTQGLAVIAVDGKPARTYRVGAAVDERWVLQSVRTRGAALGPRGGNTQVQLELPPPPVASTGTLPAAGSETPAAAPQPGRPPVAGAAPRNLPPGQMAPGMARQQIPPQEVPVQEAPVQEAPVQQEVEPAEPAQGQGG